MRTIGPVAREIVEWAFVKGDHACKQVVAGLPAQLLDAPNFASDEENLLRLGALCRGRGGMVLGARFFACKGFHEVELDVSDFSNALTVFGCPLEKFVAAYDNAYRHRLNRPIPGLPSDKTFGEVDAMFNGFRAACAAGLPKPQPGWHSKPSDALDFHRTIWVQSDAGWVILDGTHRAVGLMWQELHHGGVPTGWPLRAFAEVQPR